MKIVDFKKIMIATDGSDCSRQVADKGIEFAKLSRGTVYAVYVVSTAYLSSMYSISPTGSENHLSPLRFQTFNRKVF